MSEQQYADSETMIAHCTEKPLGDDRDKCLFGSSYVALEDTVAMYNAFKQTRQSVILVCKEPATCGGRGSPWGLPQWSGRGGRRLQLLNSRVHQYQIGMKESLAIQVLIVRPVEVSRHH